MDDKLKNYIVGGKKRDVQILIAKLKFISKITEGKKVDVHEQTLLDDNIYTAFKRTFLNYNKESKNKSFDFIKEIYDDAIETTDALSKENDKFYIDIGKMLIKEMTSAIEGVRSFIKTYSDDNMFISKVEAFLNVTQTKVSYLENAYQKI